MIVQETNYWKIGLLVSLTLATGVAALFYLGARRLSRDRVERVSYFDESVQGLEIGAPVKMRGVTIGVVKDITIAPDHRLVQVTADIYVDAMVRLGLGTRSEIKSYQSDSPQDLRVKLATTGVTGVKFLLVDFFPDAAPPPPLSFEAPRGYLPSTPSTLKNMEESFNSLSGSLPEALAAFTEMTRTVERQVGALDVAASQAAMVETLEALEGTVKRLDALLEEAQAANLVESVTQDLDALREGLWKADRLLDQLGAEGGLFERMAADVSGIRKDAGDLLGQGRLALEEADLPATSRALRRTLADVGSLTGNGMAGELRETLQLLRETLFEVQTLVTTIDRQPGVFLQGRAPDSPRPLPSKK